MGISNLTLIDYLHPFAVGRADISFRSRLKLSQNVIRVYLGLLPDINAVCCFVQLICSALSEEKSAVLQH